MSTHGIDAAAGSIPVADVPRGGVLGDHPEADVVFLGMRGDLEATRRVAKEFKVYFEKRPGKTPDSYSIDHSAQSYVIDPQGRLRLFVRHDRIAEDLADDLRVLLK